MHRSTGILNGILTGVLLFKLTFFKGYRWYYDKLILFG